MIIGNLIVGRYKIVEILSSRELYQTYLTQDISQPDYPNCVVKHLSVAANSQPQTLVNLRQLFTREAQALEKLGNHDQVPQLLTHFEANQEFYLVQEYVPGHPLNIELQPNKRWSERQVIALLQEILSILEYVHSHKLIHRDIKPSNLIRRSTDQRIVLIDFGSVKQVWTQVVTAQGRTSTKLVEGIPATIAIGTPGYMPTEQGRGRPRPNSDIYALGMIGIQALTGRSPSQLLEDAETGEIIWQQYADVSPQLAQIIDKMVRYHFKDRYQSVTEVLQALQSLTQFHTVSPAAVNRVKRQPTPAATDKRSPISLGTDISDAPINSSENKLAMLIGLAIGTTSAVVALIIGSYYSLRPPAPRSGVQIYQSAPITLPRNPLANLSLATTLTEHSDSVWSIAVTPDSHTLVSGSADKTIKVWNLDTGQLSGTLSGHSDTVRSVSLSADGQTLASGSGDSTIKLWNILSEKLLHTLSGHSGPVWSVAISRDGQNLVSGGEDGYIKVWNPQTGELRRTLLGHSGRVFSIAINPDGQTFATGSIDKTIKIWNLQTGKLLSTLAGHSDSTRSVAISPDGRTLASGSWDKTVTLWDLRTGEQLHRFNGHTARVVSVGFSADGQTLFSAGIDNSIKVWSLQTRQLLRSLVGHSDWVLAITSSPSGQTLISSSKDKTIKIWQP